MSSKQLASEQSQQGVDTSSTVESSAPSWAEDLQGGMGNAAAQDFLMGGSSPPAPEFAAGIAAPPPITDRVGIWGEAAGVFRRELFATNFVSAHASLADATAAALGTPGASVIIEGQPETGGFLVYEMTAPAAWTQLTRANCTGVTRASMLHAEPGVAAFVTVDGFVVNGRDALFSSDAVDALEGAGVGALGEDVLEGFERAMRGVLERLLDAAEAGGNEQTRRDPEEGVPVAERLIEIDEEFRCIHSANRWSPRLGTV